ncbi:MAG: hypothetical protein ACK4S4_16040 [Pyrinomonadaceae bacterium]
MTERKCRDCAHCVFSPLDQEFDECSAADRFRSYANVERQYSCGPDANRFRPRPRTPRDTDYDFINDPPEMFSWMGD